MKTNRGRGAGRAGGLDSVCIWTLILVPDGARIRFSFF